MSTDSHNLPEWAIAGRKKALIDKCDILSAKMLDLKELISEKALQGYQRIIDAEKMQINAANGNEIQGMEEEIPRVINDWIEKISYTEQHPAESAAIWKDVAEEESALQKCDELYQEVQTASKNNQIPKAVSDSFLREISALKVKIEKADPKEIQKLAFSEEGELQALQKEVAEAIDVTEAQKNAEFQEQLFLDDQLATLDEAMDDAQNTVVVSPSQPTLSTSTKAAIGLSALAVGGATSALVYQYGTNNIGTAVHAGSAALSVTFAVLLVAALASTLSKNAPAKFEERDIFAKQDADFSMKSVDHSHFGGGFVK